MIKLGEVVVILDLHRQGLSVSAIARACGLDRKTVRRYIERVASLSNDGSPVLVNIGPPLLV